MSQIEAALADRITAYLAGGGLFNPEMANHYAVRDLLMECRAALSQQSPAPSPEPVAWFVDSHEGYEERHGFKMTPDWIEVRPGDPMWSGRWKRYALYAPPAPSVEPPDEVHSAQATKGEES